MEKFSIVFDWSEHRSQHKIEIFEFVKTLPISKSLELQYGTFATSVQPGTPKI